MNKINKLFKIFKPYNNLKNNIPLLTKIFKESHHHQKIYLKIILNKISLLIILDLLIQGIQIVMKIHLKKTLKLILFKALCNRKHLLIYKKHNS